MKKFLALAVLATTATSFAASDRAIYDIMYLPSAGTTFGISELTLVNRDIKGDNDTEISGYGLTQTIGHSVTDRLALAASLNYADIEIDPDGGSKSTQDGFSDPSFTAKFRAIEEDFTLDLIGSLLVSVGDSEIESDGDTDNLQGGHALNLGAQLGKKMGDMQWALAGTYTRNFERTYEVEGPGPFGGDVDLDSNNEIEFRGDILNKLAEKSFLRSHLSVAFEDELETDDGDNYNSSSTTYEIGTEYQHLMSADLLLRVGLDYAMINHDSGSIDSDNSLNLIVGANYQF